MKDCCLNCKHFKIWNGDPCCLYKDEWKILLPTEYCIKHKKETFKPTLELHLAMWSKCKQEFFNIYTIEHQDMIDRYLEMFPDDKDLINPKR